jgi:hypothetical protein
VTPPERTAVLIVRAWRESPEGTVRCRIVLSDDISMAAQRSLAASGTEEVCAIVRDWLEGVSACDAPVMTR